MSMDGESLLYHNDGDRDLDMEMHGPSTSREQTPMAMDDVDTVLADSVYPAISQTVLDATPNLAPPPPPPPVVYTDLPRSSSMIFLLHNQIYRDVLKGLYPDEEQPGRPVTSSGLAATASLESELPVQASGSGPRRPNTGTAGRSDSTLLGGFYGVCRDLSIRNDRLIFLPSFLLWTGASKRTLSEGSETHVVQPADQRVPAKRPGKAKKGKGRA